MAPPPVFPQEDEPGLETQLQTALAAPGVDPDLLARGRRLLGRLARPVQVVVLGHPGSGKSAVIDMLLGARIAGQVSGLAMVELVYGDTPEVVFGDARGTGTPQAGHLEAFQIPKGSVSGQQSLPHPLLKTFSLTEIALAGDVAQQQVILRHAVEYGDIILWCSPAFGTEEQALWDQVPEQKRDSGFLVLTRADQLIMRGLLQENVARLSPITEESFLGLYPVAALQGLQAKGGGPGTDQSLWRACGGQRLAADLRRRVAQGRGAMQDQAEAMLWQLSLHVPQSGAAPMVPSRPAAPAVRPPAEIKTPPPVQDATGQDVLAQALAQLQTQAETMLAEAGDEPQSAAVLDQCLVAVRDLAETLMIAGDGGAGLQAAREASQDGEEMLMLLQLEQDEDAAVDAVTLLLQLKKELSDPALPARREGE